MSTSAWPQGANGCYLTSSGYTTSLHPPRKQKGGTAKLRNVRNFHNTTRHLASIMKCWIGKQNLHAISDAFLRKDNRHQVAVKTHQQVPRTDSCIHVNYITSQLQRWKRTLSVALKTSKSLASEDTNYFKKDNPSAGTIWVTYDNEM